jgi:hypothetical protein
VIDIVDISHADVLPFETNLELMDHKPILLLGIQYFSLQENFLVYFNIEVVSLAKRFLKGYFLLTAIKQVSEILCIHPEHKQSIF